MIPRSLSATRLPNESARIMRDAATGLGLSWRQLCDAAHLDPSSLDEPFGHISGAAEMRLQNSFALATAGSAPNWLRMGLNYRLLTYGPLGIAMMSARDVTEGLKVVFAYQELTFSLLSYRPLYEDGVIRAIEADDSGLEPGLRDFSMMRDLGAVLKMCSDMLQRPFPLQRISVAAPAPADWPQYRSLYDCPVQFDAPRTIWEFHKGAGALPLPLSDRLLADSYTRQCGELTRAAQQRDDMAALLTSVFGNGEQGFPSAGEAAARLGLSLRTMHRRLADQGASFGAVLAAAREARARHLLRDSRLSLEAIAGNLGFSDAACFTRAFKRRTGMAPSAWRKQAERRAD